MAAARRYSVEAAWRFGSEGEQTWQGAILDSMTGPVGLGLLFAYNRTIPTSPSASELPEWKIPGDETEVRRQRMSVGGAIGGALLNRKFTFGVNGFYHRTASTYGASGDAVDFGAGLGLMLADHVHLGLSAENVLPHQSFDDAPLRVGGGLRWAPTSRSGIEVDALADLDAAGGPALVLHAGGTLWIAEKVPLAACYAHDGAAGTDLLSAGVGVGNEKAALRYTFQTPVPGTTDAFRSAHAVGLRLEF